MNLSRLALAGILFTLMFALGTHDLRAHCDGMDGPVVKAAERALETGDVHLALVWVREIDEPEIRKAFERTLAVRKLGPEARKLAEVSFFETLVRVHRAGEGAPYTGLKPAGRDLGPAIPAADMALESGTEEQLVRLVTDAAEKGIRERFRQVLARRRYDRGNVPAGREYVKAYVEYVHYVERLYQAAHRPAHGHVEEDSHQPEEHDHR